MIGRRIVYGVALLAALAFQIFYDGYLAQFLLVCIIALPLLSLSLSLRAAVGVRLELTPSLPRLVQEESGAWQVSVKTHSFLPVPRLTMILILQNSLTGTKQRERLGFTGLSQGMVRTIPMDTSHCGLPVDDRDGIRITRGGAWALIRPSGTEPLVRVYTESKDPAEAKQLMDEILGEISGYLE